MNRSFVLAPVVPVLALAILVPVARAAQAEPPSSFQATAYLTAVVTDGSGKVVAGLKAEDFRLEADSQPQAIEQLAYLDMASGAIRSQAPLPVLLKPDDVHRTIILVVDDLSLSLDGVNRVRGALEKFLEQQMSERDQAAILRSSGGTGTLERLTSDKRVLTTALRRIRYTHSNRPLALDETVAHVLGGLQPMHGRKAVVVFSESASSLLTVPSLADVAERAGATLYAVDPRAGAAAADIPLVAATGGFTLAGADVEGNLAKVLADQAGYYLIGYRTSYPPAGNLRLQVTPGGLQVRFRRAEPAARPGYSTAAGGSEAHIYAMPETHGGTNGELPAGPPAAAASPEVELRRALRSPFSAGDIGVTLNAACFDRAGPAVSVSLRVDPRAVATTLTQDGSRTGALQLEVAVFDVSGGDAQNTGGSIALRMTEKEYQQALRTGLATTVELALHMPGVYEVRAAVYDATNGHVGYARQSIEAPNSRGGQLQVSDLSLKPADPQELTDAAYDRVFSSGQGLTYTYQVVNAQLDAGKHAQLARQLVLFQEGKTLFTGEVVAIPAGSETDPSKPVLTGTMKLGTGLTAGDYVLELNVTDQLAGRTTAHYVDFSVR